MLWQPHAHPDSSGGGAAWHAGGGDQLPWMMRTMIGFAQHMFTDFNLVVSQLN